MLVSAFMKRTILLLTACVNPGEMKYTVLQDVEERKRQYKSAIDYYLEKTKYQMVFCDNSGADLTELKNPKYANRIEFLSFVGNNYDVNYGKGYGEYLIIQYAFAHSSFLQQASSVIKITGRLIVEELCQTEKLNRQVFGCLKSFVFVSPSALDMEDSRCFIASKDFFSKCFLTASNTINDTKGYFFEHFLYDMVTHLPKSFIVSDFILPLQIKGVSGSTGRVYCSIKMGFIEKLTTIRNYCQANKRYYKAQNRAVYFRMSWVAFVVRIVRALAIRIGVDAN